VAALGARSEQHFDDINMTIGKALCSDRYGCLNSTRDIKAVASGKYHSWRHRLTSSRS